MTRWPLFCGHRCRGLWWFRVLGRGLAWKDTRRHPLLFSQRMGLDGWKSLHVGHWFVRYVPYTEPGGSGSK